MRGLLLLLVIVVIGLILAIHFGYIDVNQTKVATLPTVEVKGGQAPAFDVHTANVSVGQKNETVTVPTVNVQKPQ